MENYHILNGDALKERFNLAQEHYIIVARECFIDGPTHGDTLKELFETRARFIQKAYGSSLMEYTSMVVEEFNRTQKIPENAAIHLWFEDDVFCQINLYFTLYLIKDHFKLPNDVYLVRPTKHTRYGFGSLTNDELAKILKDKTYIKDSTPFIALWKAFQKKDTASLTKISEALHMEFPFIKDAMKAYITSLPTNENQGVIVTCLKSIKQELDTEEFASIFTEFCKRMPIYGYGDLQIKRMLDTL